MPSPILVLNSQTHYVADGSTTTWNFNFAGGYISKDHVKAYKIEPGTELIVPIPLLEADIGEAQVSIIPAIIDGASVVIYRDTPKDMPLVDYTNGQGYDEASLDTTAKQAVFIAAEVLDRAGQALNVGGGVAELQELLLGGSGAGLVGYFNAVPYPANTVGSGIKSARTVALAAEAAAEAALTTVNNAVALKANKAGDTFTGTVTVPELRLDGTASLGVSSGVVNILLDTGDGLVYNRVTNTLDVNLGGSRMTVSAAAGPERTSDASTANGLVRKSQAEAIAAAAIEAAGRPSVPIGVTKLHITTTGRDAAVNINAGSASLVDPAGNVNTHMGIYNEVINFNTTGANALDSGTKAANTWYSIWLISDGVQVAALASTSSTAPTMPSGYTFKLRVGWVRTDSTGNAFPLRTKQVGRWAAYMPLAGTNVTAHPIAVSGAYTGNLSIQGFVPPTAEGVTVKGLSWGGSNFHLYVGTTVDAGVLQISDGSVTTNIVTADFLMDQDRAIYVTGQASTAVGIIGWEDNL